MGEKAYKRYVERGPDALPLEETKAALEFRDTHPVAAGRIRAAVETRRREAQDKGALRGALLAQGGDERAFEREWPKMRGEAEAARLRELDRGAREAGVRHTRSVF